MGDREKTFGERDTLRGVTGGAAWQAAEGLTFGDLETLREEGVVLAGRYKVLKRLGEGGMGSVWLAEDSKLDGRKVAVKMLPAILVGKKGAYKQVKAEAMVAMKLSHPNIATVRAFEEDEGGNPFLVMDYIEGEGLDDILAEKGALGEEETLRILGSVAAALDYAHSQGVVHRDVKPGNVMVRKDGTPFVLDFGIAREVQETMTRVTGKLSSGTLLYMSPEQLNGDRPKVAQDVYSFAAMAYECLAGEPPFCRGAIEDQIKHKTPEALPDGVGTTLRQGVMAGLAKEADERPGSCEGVLGGGTAKKGESRFAGSDNRKANSAKWWKEEADKRARTVLEVRRQEGQAKAKRGKRVAEAEARSAQRAVQQRKRETVAAGKTRQRVVGWSVFLVIAMLVVVIGGHLWLQSKADPLRQQDTEDKTTRLTIPTPPPQSAEAPKASSPVPASAKGGKRGAASATRTSPAAALGRGSYEGETKEITLKGGATMEMVWCPAGSFTMGSPGGMWGVSASDSAVAELVSWAEEVVAETVPGGTKNEGGRYDNEAQHRVTLTDGFWMAKTEVTQEQWRSVMGDNPSRFKGDNLPVENVSWDNAQEFCNKTGLRLPTEAEWEYACRAGSTTAFFWGNALNGDKANCNGLYPYGTMEKGPYMQKTMPVGTYEPNNWGLCEMPGNVWEWCADWWGVYPTEAVTNPTGGGASGYRVLRGGSWNTDASRCRSAGRGNYDPGCGSNDYGEGFGFRPCVSAIR